MMKVTYISAATGHNDPMLPAITIDPDLCDGCNLCLAACSLGALAMAENRITCVETEVCDACRVCEYICGRGAISWHYQVVSLEVKQ